MKAGTGRWMPPVRCDLNSGCRVSGGGVGDLLPPRGPPHLSARGVRSGATTGGGNCHPLLARLLMSAAAAEVAATTAPMIAMAATPPSSAPPPYLALIPVAHGAPAPWSVEASSAAVAASAVVTMAVAGAVRRLTAAAATSMMRSCGCAGGLRDSGCHLSCGGDAPERHRSIFVPLM